MCIYAGTGCRCTRAGEESVSPLGRYVCMADLHKMHSLRPSLVPPLPLSLRVLSTPLVWEEWRAELSLHPDHEFAAWIEEGIAHGFWIGFNYETGMLGTRATKNMQSAVAHPQPVDEYVNKERGAGGMIKLKEE